MTSDRDRAFGDRLRGLRTARGLTQRELAEEAGVGKRSVEDYEQGVVPRKAIPALARAVGVSPHYLLHGVDTVEDKIDGMTAELVRVEERLSQLEQLIAQAAAANRRIWYSLDATLRLVLAQIAPDEVLAQLPDPPRLDTNDGDGEERPDVQHVSVSGR